MNADKDLNYMFALTHYVLRIYGLWPDPHIPSSDFRWPNIRTIIIVINIITYVFTPQMLNAIHAWGNNVTRMVECITSANLSLVAVCKLFVTWYYAKILQSLIVSIMTDWTTSTSNWERSNMLKIARRGRSFSFRCGASTAIMILTFVIFQVLGYYKNQHRPYRILAYRMDNIQKSPNYEITYILQVFGASFTATANYVIDSFVSILVLHVCSQLINLRTALDNLVNELTNNSIPSLRFREGITAIVVRHEHLMRNAKTIDACFSSILFMNLLIATIQMCFITFQLFTVITTNLKVPVLRMMFLLLYITYTLMNFYTYCYAAELLRTESVNMANGVFECKWYDLPPKEAKDLMFIVHRSTIPLKLTAGKFGTFSLEMFGTALKTSMGYLSALLTIIKD